MLGGASPDWSEPWFAPVAADGRSVQCHLSAGHDLPQALGALPACPVRFVPQTALPPATAYEQFIFDTGCVPTRENLHDFFNGLCWLRFPQTKQRLNRLQAAEIAAAGVREVRGPVRDALTLFDENAALLQAPEPLWDALTARDWHSLFVTLAPALGAGPAGAVWPRLAGKTGHPLQVDHGPRVSRAGTHGPG